MGVLSDVLTHPDELVPVVKMVVAAKRATRLPKDKDLAFCYDILNSVSRSFAVVIQQLPNPLRDATCIFYLALRGLDTVEDDMAIPEKTKLPALLSFHKKLYEEGFSMDCGYNHYKRLMANFGIVVRAFLRLDRVYQGVIADITRRMGEGMAEFITKEVMTVADYDKYCHYVAGLVGIGLSQLFASSELESDEFAAPEVEGLANHMGLFLQKTNIIRDYLEDIMEEPAPRMFWPRAIWGRYAGQLADFKERHQRKKAVQCLNHMIVDALRHLPHCIEYMTRLQHEMVFRFCAIPQIMAAATLARCYNNGKVFEGVVKIRRGETCRIFAECSDMGDLLRWFKGFLGELAGKVAMEVDEDDPTVVEAGKAVASNLELCEKELREWSAHNAGPKSLATYLGDCAGLVASGAYLYYAVPLGQGTGRVEALPEALRPYAWALHDYRAWHIATALLLLLAMLRAVVMCGR